MNALTTTQPMTTPQPALNLERFFERVRLTNPFHLDRVTQPALAAEMDAQTVHQAQFRRLLELAHTARDQHVGVGVVLWGEAGVGKSHLLSRLARWAHRDDQACFVYLQNLQPGPENLPRSLLRVTVSILTRGRLDRFHETPLFRLVQAAVETALRESAETLDPERAYAGLLDRLSAQAPAQPAFVDRTIYNVLFRFLRSALAARTEPDDGVAALAVRWLSGDPLDPEDALRLGLPPQLNRQEAVALADDQQIKLVLVALSQMALFARQPLLLCFDQVENVENAQISAMTRFLQAVLDGAPNLLVVTCGVYETLHRWHEERVIHEAAWDRIAQFQIALPRVTAAEGRQIVEARLEPFLTPFMELPPVKNCVHEDRLFPLGAAWFDEYLKDKVDLRPRHVIKWARDGWDNAQLALREMDGARWLADWGKKPPPPGPKPRPEPLETVIDRKVAAKLEEQKQQRLLDPETLPPDADNLAGLAYILLRQCLHAPRSYALTDVQRPAPPNRKQRPTYHLTVKQHGDGQENTVGVLFLTAGDASSAVWALRRLIEDRLPPTRLLLVTDQRRPMRLAAKGKEYLDQLRRNYGGRFQRIDLTFDQYADLDALKAAAGMALSGDLEIDLPGGEIRRVTEAEVVASHHRGDRYTAHVLLRPLLGVVDSSVITQNESENRDKAKSVYDSVPEKGEGTSPLQINCGRGGVAPPAGDTVSVPAKAPEEQDVREFIWAHLALVPGASSHELIVKYVDYRKNTNRPPLDSPACKKLLEAAARGLHQTGHVHVTPTEDGFYVLPRKR